MKIERKKKPQDFKMWSSWQAFCDKNHFSAMNNIIE